MIFNHVAAVVLRQFYLIQRNVPRLLSLVVWVVVDTILWGFMTHYLDTVSSTKFSFVPTILGAVLLWNFLVRVMHGLSAAFMEDSWSRNLFNFFASPLSITEYVTGLALTGIMTSILGLAAMLFLATVVFGMSIFSYGILILPFLLILFITGTALGIFGAGIMLRYGPSSEWLIWPVPAFIAPFAGVFYPLDTLPDWMQKVSMLIPPSYVFESIRHIMAGDSIPLQTLWIGFGLSIFYVILACFFFTRICRFAIRTGLIARYGTENIGG